MNASQEIQAVIEALPDPVLILAPNRGRVLAYNKAFVDKWGFAEETFMDKPFLKMPQFSRAIQRGLIGVYAKARHRRAEIAPFSFCYPDMKGFLKTFSASASPIEEAGSVDVPCVMLRFQERPRYALRRTLRPSTSLRTSRMSRGWSFAPRSPSSPRESRTATGATTSPTSGSTFASSAPARRPSTSMASSSGIWNPRTAPSS